MKPVVRSLKRDIRRMVTVPAAWIVIIGLLFVPALYAWFNIVGFWDPYSNTGKIRVAVANEDQGATKDAIGFVNVGHDAGIQATRERSTRMAFRLSRAGKERS